MIPFIFFNFCLHHFIIVFFFISYNFNLFFFSFFFVELRYSVKIMYWAFFKSSGGRLLLCTILMFFLFKPIRRISEATMFGPEAEICVYYLLSSGVHQCGKSGLDFLEISPGFLNQKLE